ncbi:hypothetical protein KY289_008109 [Solanum tuberosum]|nr:hypothetical protein KY289_008109 [Solanum tuberosum]
MGSNIIIQFNPASQLPIKLSDGENFATSKEQFFMLMYGYNLFAHLNGTTPAPNLTISLGTNISHNPAFSPWFRQDKLFQNAFMAYVEPIIAYTVITADSAKSARDALHTIYTNKSQIRVYSLRDHLSRVTKDSRSITEYLHNIRSLSDELATTCAPVSNHELIVKILRVWGLSFKRYLLPFVHLIRLYPMRNCLQNYWTTNSFFTTRMLRSCLVPSLQQSPLPPKKTPIIATIACRQPILNNGIGHTANVCRSKSHNNFEAKANYAAGFTAATNPWIVDSGATNHITTEPHKLQPYHGNKDVSIGDDLKTRKPMVHGRTKNGLYEWPVPPPQAHMTTTSIPLTTWHQCLGHPHTLEFVGLF